MPIVRVQVPAGVFDRAASEKLILEVNEAAAAAEQMPADPAYRLGLIVLWEELPAGAIRSNAADPVGLVAPVFVWFFPPDGVLDDAHAAEFVARVQEIFSGGDAGQQVTTSVVIQPVADGRWGIGGAINRLPDFAARAGYRHLQHLVRA